MLSIIKEYWYLIMIGGSGLVSLIRLIVKKQTRAREDNEEYQKKLKNQVLNEALKNNMAHHNTFQQVKQAAPVETRPQDNRQESVKQGLILMRLTVRGASQENYVVSVKDHVYLGSGAGQNDIVLNNAMIAPRQCDYFLHQGHVFVRNLQPSNPVLVRRKKNQAAVGTGGIQLMTGDEMMIGGQQIQITFMDYVGNIIAG